MFRTLLQNRSRDSCRKRSQRQKGTRCRSNPRNQYDFVDTFHCNLTYAAYDTQSNSKIKKLKSHDKPKKTIRVINEQ